MKYKVLFFATLFACITSAGFCQSESKNPGNCLDGLVLPGIGVEIDGREALLYVPTQPTKDLVYKWDFGDGTPSQITFGNYVRHSYERLANYTVTLAVYSKCGVRILKGSADLFPYHVEPDPTHPIAIKASMK